MGEQTKFPRRATPLRMQVYQHLRESIVRGVLKPGEMYSEHQISLSLGVSKTPVREAMLQLNQEGMIEYYPYRGLRVKEIGEDDLREIFEMRCAIESYAFESLKKKINNKILEDAEESLNKQKKLIAENNKESWISATFFPFINCSLMRLEINEWLLPLRHFQMMFNE